MCCYLPRQVASRVSRIRGSDAGGGEDSVTKAGSRSGKLSIWRGGGTADTAASSAASPPVSSIANGDAQPPLHDTLDRKDVVDGPGVTRYGSGGALGLYLASLGEWGVSVCV